MDGDEEVAGADLAGDTRLWAGEVEGDEVSAEVQAWVKEPAEQDNASEDEFAAGEQEGHIEELFLNISDDIEGACAWDKGLDEGGLAPVAYGGDKAPDDDDDGTDLLLPGPEAPLNLYKEVEQRTKDVKPWHLNVFAYCWILKFWKTTAHVGRSWMTELGRFALNIQKAFLKIHIICCEH